MGREPVAASSAPLPIQGALLQTGAQFPCLGSQSSQPAGATWLSTCLCAHARVHMCVCVCVYKNARRRGLCVRLFAGEPVPHPHLLLQPQRTGCPDSSLHLWGPVTTATTSVVCAPGLGGRWGHGCRVCRCAPCVCRAGLRGVVPGRRAGRA